MGAGEEFESRWLLHRSRERFPLFSTIKLGFWTLFMRSTWIKLIRWLVSVLVRRPRLGHTHTKSPRNETILWFLFLCSYCIVFPASLGIVNNNSVSLSLEQGGALFWMLSHITTASWQSTINRAISKQIFVRGYNFSAKPSNLLKALFLRVFFFAATSHLPEFMRKMCARLTGLQWEWVVCSLALLLFLLSAEIYCRG